MGRSAGAAVVEVGRDAQHHRAQQVQLDVRVGPERVKFAVQRLRRHMSWHPPARSPIESVRGFGYRYRYRGAGWRAA